MGFFGFLRSGEFTLPAGTTFNPNLHLTPRDIQVDDIKKPTMLKVHLKSSKIDQERNGLDLFIGQTKNSLCPVVAMLRYLEVRGIDDGPLFREESRILLAKERLVQKVRQALELSGIDSFKYAGHSFRIGAATTAASKGISDAVIQILGRWRSDSFNKYIRTPRYSLAHTSQLLAQ